LHSSNQPKHSEGLTLGQAGLAPGKWPIFYHLPIVFEARATNSSNLESKSFKIGDSFDFLYPITKSIVGIFPARERLVKDEGRKFCAYAGKSATPRVDATNDIAIPRLSTAWLGFSLLPDCLLYREI